MTHESARPADDPAERHQREAAGDAARSSIGCAVLTVSDSRTLRTDTSGAAIVQLLGEAGHPVLERTLVADEPAEIDRIVRAWAARTEVMAIMVTGGTGVAPRDRTVEVVRRLLTIELEGFGELFRMLSYRQIGAAAMLSRAVGGLIAAPESGCESLVFAMPGSSNAVRLAMTELILPQLPHLAYLRSAHPQTSSERASPPSGSDH